MLEEERPQLVSIVAPAGTGKTRLLEEFLKRLDPDEDFQVAMVRCLPYGQTLTYWPLQGLQDDQWRVRILDAFYNNRYVPINDDDERLHGPLIRSCFP